MKTTTIILTLFSLALCRAASNPDLDEEWEDFQQRYDKQIPASVAEVRRAIWESNVNFIEQHNTEAARGEHSFTVGINEYADLSVDEFVRIMNGYNMSDESNGPIETFPHLDDADMPTEVNWVKKGYVTGVKNQEQCGSCWAFSTTGSLEGQHFKKSGKLVSLSEQNLVDCDKVDLGCMGGLMENAYKYIKMNNGIDTEASYPYTAKTGRKCLFKKEDVGATLTSFVKIPKGNEAALMKAVSSIGPVSVAIDAGHRSFQLYKDGIYYEKECSSTRLDHGVLAVGYGSGNTTATVESTMKDYWLVKNSWGATWGMEGYIKMSRNRMNNCGIATDASYPVV